MGRACVWGSGVGCAGVVGYRGGVGARHLGVCSMCVCSVCGWWVGLVVCRAKDRLKAATKTSKLAGGLCGGGREGGREEEESGVSQHTVDEDAERLSRTKRLRSKRTNSGLTREGIGPQERSRHAHRASSSPSHPTHQHTHVPWWRAACGAPCRRWTCVPSAWCGPWLLGGWWVVGGGCVGKAGKGREGRISAE